VATGPPLSRARSFVRCRPTPPLHRADGRQSRALLERRNDLAAVTASAGTAAEAVPMLLLAAAEGGGGGIAKSASMPGGRRAAAERAAPRASASRGLSGSSDSTTSGQLNIANGQTGILRCPEAKSEPRIGFYAKNRV